MHAHHGRARRGTVSTIARTQLQGVVLAWERLRLQSHPRAVLIHVLIVAVDFLFFVALL